MKFELGDIVYALHFDKYSEISLDECLVIGMNTRVQPDFSSESKYDLKEGILAAEIELHRITYHQDSYILWEEEGAYKHWDRLVFKTKQEALIYLHGLISDIAK